MQTLAPHVTGLVCGRGLAYGRLALVPLEGPAPSGGPDYELAADALAAGTFRAAEVSEAGSVPELAVVNEGARPVLLLDGEELVGAKQNRMLNTSLLVPAGGKTRIPVSCVEQGRWHARGPGPVAGAGGPAPAPPAGDEAPGPGPVAGGWSPSRLRAIASRDVGRNLRASGRARSDQAAVWDEVAEHLASLPAPSPTMALHEAFLQQRESLEDYRRALPYPAGARGVFVALEGGFAALDLFDRPQTLARVWPRLVAGYALDALARQGGRRSPRILRGPEVILERLTQMGADPCPSPGLGEDWRLEAEDVVGRALVVEGACLHLSAFPNVGQEPGGADGAGPRMAPPSRRRRGRRGPPPTGGL